MGVKPYGSRPAVTRTIDAAKWLNHAKVVAAWKRNGMDLRGFISVMMS